MYGDSGEGEARNIIAAMHAFITPHAEHQSYPEIPYTKFPLFLPAFNLLKSISKAAIGFSPPLLS
jgi:hypothetical protein